MANNNQPSHSRGSLGSFFDASLLSASTKKDDSIESNNKLPVSADIIFLPRHPHVKVKKVKKAHAKEPNFSLNHGMLQINPTVHKSILDDCAKRLKSEWRNPNSIKVEGRPLFENYDALFEPEKPCDDSLSIEMETEAPIDMSNGERRRSKQKLITIDGLQYDFHTFNLKHQLRQYRNLSIFSHPGSPAKAVHTEKMKRITEQLRETKESQSLVHTHFHSVKLDKLMREKYSKDFLNTKNGPPPASADAILFVECMKNFIVPFRIKEFIHSSNYKVLFEDKRIDEDLESHSKESSTVADSIHEEDDSKSIQSLSYDDRNVACAIENNEVVAIDLMNRGIGCEKGLCLAESMKYCTSLLTINISGNRLNDRTLAAILQAIYQHTNCTSFDLSDNTMGPNSMEALLSCIENNRVVFLNLNKCCLEDDDIGSLLSSLSTSTTLESLLLGNNKIGKQEQELQAILSAEKMIGLRAINNFLKINKSITYLDLSNTYIRNIPSLPQFIEQLAKHDSLKTLDLSGNNIGDSDSQLIFHALLSNTTLTQLDMSTNGILSKAAITLSYTIRQHNSTLRYVNLKNNSIGPTGCLSLISAVQKCALRHAMNSNIDTKASITANTIHSISEKVSAIQLENDYKERMVAIAFDVELAMKRSDSKDIFNEHRIPSVAKYLLNLANPYEFAVANTLLLSTQSTIQRNQNTSSYRYASIIADNPLASVANAKYKDAKGIMTDSISFNRDDSTASTPNNRKVGATRRRSFGVADPKNSRRKIAELMGQLNNGFESLKRHQEDPEPIKNEIRQFLVELFSKYFKFSAELLNKISSMVVDELTQVPDDIRGTFEVLFIVVAKSIFRHMLQHKELMKRFSSKRNVIDANILQSFLKMIGFEDPMSYFGKLYVKNEYAERLLSETDIFSLKDSAIKSITTGLASASLDRMEVSQGITEDYFVHFLFLHTVNMYGYERTPIYAISNGAGFLFPNNGSLQFELNYPQLIPSSNRVLSNQAFTYFFDAITGEARHLDPRISARHGNSLSSPKESIKNFEKILFVLNNTTDRVFYLTCDQAEVFLIELYAVKVLPFKQIAEKLILQIANSSHVCSFLTRNFYFEELVALSKKWGYLFKVLTGYTCGHYSLDMNNSIDQLAGVRLAELNNFQILKFRRGESDKLNTSQLGDGNFFRNCLVNGRHVTLTSEYFIQKYQNAVVVNSVACKVEFDFVSTIRPAMFISKSAQTLKNGLFGGENSTAPQDTVKHILSVINREKKTFDEISMRIQPKNLACIKQPNTNNANAKKSDLKISDEDDYLKIINVKNHRRKQDSFVNRIKQFGIITGNSSKYAAEAKSKENSNDSASGEYDEEPTRRGSEKGNEVEETPVVVKEVVEIPKNEFINAMLRASNAESQKPIEVGNNPPSNVNKRRQAILFDRRTLNPSNPMSKSAPVGPSPNNVNIEAMSKSANFLEWRSICKTSYSVYKKLYKYKMALTASSSRLLEVSTAGASSHVAASIEDDENEKLRATRALGSLPMVVAVDFDSIFGKPRDHNMDNGSMHYLMQKINETTADCCRFDESLHRLQILVLYKVFLTIDQVVMIMKTLKAQRASIEVLIRCLCILWGSILDMDNLNKLLLEISDSQLYELFRSEAFHRLGILHVW
eukprot:CAMPEP_0170107348 /NCGR_PEP_ID=MMETSP0020_2-20130122/5922_1 /TAXON_ID=98059 /ORGANISM="Dinobryon sp., Strain UTEXLB2267" /LENGTH=1638 /DNA_ID=CAMNT_0010331861 /DNA_START=21 /DNA_END=4934 /DNA_ORIENTATION=+